MKNMLALSQERFSARKFTSEAGESGGFGLHHGVRAHGTIGSQ